MKIQKFNFSEEKISSLMISSFRERYEILNFLLNIATDIIINDIVECEEEKNIILYVDKMNRLFFEKNKSIHSFVFPFSHKIENQKIILTKFNIKIDSMYISILKSILNSYQKNYNNITLDIIFESFFENLESYTAQNLNAYKEIENNICELILYLLSYEIGYMRYDFDEERENNHTHPKYHIDIGFSSSSTFKLGLQNELKFNDFIEILDVNKKCYYIH